MATYGKKAGEKVKAAMDEKKEAPAKRAAARKSTTARKAPAKKAAAKKSAS
jgi:hypothetical protein